jgi:hypothetical protein
MRVKSQAPNPKRQRTPNRQIPSKIPLAIRSLRLVWDLTVGSGLGFGAWDLGF